jgi:hypothetical protein
MSESAQVTSLEALQAFKAALARFGVEAQKALYAADAEVRHAVEGVQRQLDYWKRQIRERQEELTKAKTALIQRRWGHQDGKGPGQTEAELAVRHAERRVREAEEKLAVCQRWQRQLPQAVQDYEGPARLLSGMLESSLKQSVVLLDNKIATLEAYVALTPAALPAAPPPAPEGGAP